MNLIGKLISRVKNYLIYRVTFTADDLGATPEQVAFLRLYGLVEVVGKTKDGREIYRMVNPRRTKDK